LIFVFYFAGDAAGLARGTAVCFSTWLTLAILCFIMRCFVVWLTLTIYKPIGSARNNYFCDFVAADVSPLIPSREKLEPTYVGCHICQKTTKSGSFCPHRSKNGRTEMETARTD